MPTWTRPGLNACLPAGERLYAIGDLHGELNLFRQLLTMIIADSERRGPARTTLVLLGDIIDRGEDAAALLLTLVRLRSPRFVLIKGNHEAAFVDCYRGNEKAQKFWLRFGGQSTLTGFGISEHEIDYQDNSKLTSAMQACIDREIIDWIDRLPNCWSRGDYFFTHAGVRPGVSLDDQNLSDLMWIREPFLSSKLYHGKVIVHGHTLQEGIPRLGGNRIGLDTGAHERGRLTALGLEENEQWILQSYDCGANSIGSVATGAERILLAASA